jgi:hypothetical protein
VSARTKPPKAWHAWARRVRVGAKRFERTEGRRDMKAGRNVAGWYVESSWIAYCIILF